MEIEEIREKFTKELKEVKELQEEGILEEPHFIGKFDPVKVKSIIDSNEIEGGHIWIDLKDYVHMFGTPSRFHDCISLSVITDIRKWLTEQNVDENMYKLSTGNRFNVGIRSKEADIGVQYDGNEPSFVGEVSFMNESDFDLKTELEFWISANSNVNSALAIKVRKRQRDGKRSMFLLYKAKSSDYEFLEFGTDLPNPPKEFMINSKDIFPNLEIDKHISINLEEIRAIAEGSEI